MNHVRSVPLAASFVCALALLGLTAGGCGKDAAPAKTSSTSKASTPASPTGGPKGPDGKGAAKGGAKGAKGGASATLSYQTALQFLMKGDPEKAHKELERAVGLDASMSEAYYELGKLDVAFSSQNVGSQSRDLEVLEKGLSELKKARDLEPSNDQYWFWIGRACFLKGDVPGAIASLKQAVELNPKHAQAWKALGRVQMSNGETDAARDSFQKAIENDPAEAGAYFQLGQALELLDDKSGARAAYEKSLGLDPTEPEVFGRLMQMCAALGDAECEAKAKAGMDGWKEYDQKLMKRRHAVNQHPGDALALRRLGEMYFQVGKWEDALEWFLKSIHVNPKDGLTHLYCGIVRRHLKDYVNATNHLKEAEFLNPDNIEPKLELLRLYAESEDRQSFDELLAKVEEAAVADGRSLYELGLVCGEGGRSDDAARLAEKAKALGVTAETYSEFEATAAAPAEGE